MSTPIRFVKRIARLPRNQRRAALESKAATVLIAVAKHYGSNCKSKAIAVDTLMAIAK